MMHPPRSPEVPTCGGELVLTLTSLPLLSRSPLGETPECQFDSVANLNCILTLGKTYCSRGLV